MLKTEFQALIDDEITDEDYLIVERIYMNYPGVCNTNGKEQVAQLYLMFGIKIFLDMLPRAEKILCIEDEIRELRYEVLEKEKELKKMQTCRYLI